MRKKCSATKRLPHTLQGNILIFALLLFLGTKLGHSFLILVVFDKVEFLEGSFPVSEGSSLIAVEPAEAELGVTNEELSLVTAEVVSVPVWNSLSLSSLQSLSGEHKVLIFLEGDLGLPSSEVGGGKSEVVSVPF